LDGSGSSDANNDVLTYQWILVSKPNGSTAQSNNAAIAKPTFVADVSGIYVWSLVVNDGAINSLADSVAVTASVPTVLLDGIWSGLDSKGQPVNITVLNNKITQVSVAYAIIGDFCTQSGSTETTFGNPLAISSNQFTASVSGSGPSATSYTLKGTFAANNTASGTLQVSFQTSFPNPNCSGSSSSTWQATKQP
jgi:hypothetical protein